MQSIMFVKGEYEIYLTKDIMGNDCISIYTFNENRDQPNVSVLKFFSKNDLQLFVEKLTTIIKKGGVE
jgi:hypothetical protein